MNLNHLLHAIGHAPDALPDWAKAAIQAVGLVTCAVGLAVLLAEKKVTAYGRRYQVRGGHRRTQSVPAKPAVGTALVLADDRTVPIEMTGSGVPSRGHGICYDPWEREARARRLEDRARVLSVSELVSGGRW